MDTKIIYIRDNNRNPHGCIAFSLNESENKTTVNYAVSICHPNDSFVKKLARNIAIQRLNKHKNKQFTIGVMPLKNYTTFYLMFKGLSDDIQIPKHIRVLCDDMCKRYLDETKT